MLFLSKELVGATKHLLVDENNIKFVDEIQDDCYVYDSENRNSKCLRTLFTLEKQEFNAVIPEHYKKAYKLLTKNSENYSIPWFRCIPRQAYMNFLNKASNDLRASYDGCDKSYYENYFVKQNKVFEALQPSYISFDNIKKYSKLEQTSADAVLNSFMPSRDGVTSRIVYDRTGSRTGRLKISAGPKILTLKKEFRNVLRSRFENGKIMSVDYSSLEARIMLYSVGRATPSGDLYDLISKEVFDEKITRNQVKQAVLSLIFGSGEVYLAHSLSIEKSEARRISREIRKYFCVSILEKRLIDSLKNGNIRNHYGRLISVPENELIVNSYIQSTGVDVALLGFSKIIDVIESMRTKQKPIPLFVLHDALILDVPENFDMTVAVQSAEHVPGFVQKFPVHVDLFAK